MAKIKQIILMMLTVAFAAAGIFGLVLNNKENNSKPTEYETYQQLSESVLSECEGFQAVADQAMKNIEGYLGQMEHNREALTGAGGDPSGIDAAIETVKKAQAEAVTMREKMENDIGKIKDSAHLDNSDPDAVTKALNTMPKRLNMVRTSLKRITKIDPDESASNLSAESTARKYCTSSAADITAAFPDLDLGEQFTVVKEAAEAAEEAANRFSFTKFLQGNWDNFLWLAGFVFLIAVLNVIGIKNPGLKHKITSSANKNMMLVALVGITVIFFILTRYKLLLPVNVSNIINQNAYIIILACGMLMCIIGSANIDLSVGRVMGFIGACAAKFMIEGKMPVYLAVPLCLLIGIAIGAWQGFWIAYVNIPAFVVTLAGQLTFYGLTMMILQGLTINNFPTAFNTIFNSYLPDILGPFFRNLGFSSKLNWTAMVIGFLVVAVFIVTQVLGRANRIKKGYPVDTLTAMWVKIAIISVVLLWLFYSMAAAFGLPTVLFTVAVVLLIYLFITSRTVMGRHLYAMGGNVNAARLSGVKTQKMLFLSYVNMGLLAALAGLVYAARLNASSPQAGAGDELYAIASCYIGGASAYGGIGTVGGALIGAMTMGVIKNGMSIMSLGQDIQQIVLGMVLLIAVVIDIVSKSNGAPLPFLSRFTKQKEKNSAK